MILLITLILLLMILWLLPLLVLLYDCDSFVWMVISLIGWWW